MKALLEEIDNLGLIIHRITQTKGIMLLTDAEIEEMVSLAKQCQIELILAIGPRATYDTSAQYSLRKVNAWVRLRGQEQIVPAIEDVKRAISLGCFLFAL